MLGGASEVESIEFSAYTAGTGNAGTTILSATVSADRRRSVLPLANLCLLCICVCLILFPPPPSLDAHDAMQGGATITRDLSRELLQESVRPFAHFFLSPARTPCMLAP